MPVNPTRNPGVKHARQSKTCDAVFIVEGMQQRGPEEEEALSQHQREKHLNKSDKLIGYALLIR